MSDHIDGPRQIGDPASDLTDLFAFTSPENPSHTVLAANVFPSAGVTAMFSNAVNHSIVVRRVALAGSGHNAKFKPSWRVLSWIGGRRQRVIPSTSGMWGWKSPVSSNRFFRPHWENIDPDKERYLVLGAGYEYLRTAHTGKLSHENRITFDMTPSLRPASKLLLRDRNRLELRWIDGNYSTTYRNLVAAEVDLRVHDIRFTPFGTVEFFYDSPKHSWDQEWYTGGLQLPYKRVFMLEVYYRREQCPTCTPENWNVGGATLNFFFKNGK
jgi:hypothetical protein